MVTYFSTFVSGLHEVVRSALVHQLNDVEIQLLLDGLVVYTSDMPDQTIKNIRFFNNTFLLLHLFPPNKKELDQKSVETVMRGVLKNPAVVPGVPRWALSHASSFRIIASRENQTETVDSDLLGKLERFFAYRLKLKTNRSKPDIEVWFLSRSEGYCFLGIRLTRAHTSDRDLEKGELRHELANLCCLISEPKKEDVFLDPFAGSGAIPIERVKVFPYKQVIASEIDKNTFEKLRKRVLQDQLKITLGNWDALDLKSIMNGSVSKIVTDPPWGIFTQPGIDLESFYSTMLKEFIRILKNDGLITILMGQKELFEKLLRNYPNLILLEKYDILVSGKKAAIYKIRYHS